MEYEGKKQPVCYQLTEPPLYSSENHEALQIWNFLASDRTVGMGPSTIRTESIIEFCRSSGYTYDMFLKVKLIENIYYSASVRKYSDRIENSKKKERIDGN